MRLTSDERHTLAKLVRHGVDINVVIQIFRVTKPTVYFWGKQNLNSNFSDLPRNHCGKITVEVEITILYLRNTFHWGTARIQQGLMNLPDFMREEMEFCVQNFYLSRTSINNVLKKHKLSNNGEFTREITNLVVFYRDTTNEDRNRAFLKTGESYRDKVNGYRITLLEANGEKAKIQIGGTPVIGLNYSNPLVYYSFNTHKIRDEIGNVKASFPISINGKLVLRNNQKFSINTDYPNPHVQNFTVSSWIKLNKDGKAIVTYNLLNYGLIRLVNKGDNNLYDLYYRNSDSVQKIIPDKWYHLVARYEEGKYIELYVNGILYNKDYVYGHTPYDVENNIQMKPYEFKGSTNAEVQIDELKIWGRALSDEEIMNEYKSFTPS